MHVCLCAEQDLYIWVVMAAMYSFDYCRFISISSSLKLWVVWLHILVFLLLHGCRVVFVVANDSLMETMTFSMYILRSILVLLVILDIFNSKIFLPNMLHWSHMSILYVRLYLKSQSLI